MSWAAKALGRKCLLTLAAKVWVVNAFQDLYIGGLGRSPYNIYDSRYKFEQFPDFLQLSSDNLHIVRIHNSLRYEELEPVITFRQLCHPMRPIEAKIKPVPGDRDGWIDGQQIFALNLTYSFSGE